MSYRSLFLVTFFFFALLPFVSPDIGFGPSAVLTTLLTTGGTPNPPGYPLWGLLSEGILRLSIGAPAQRLAWLNLFFSAASLAGLVLLVQRALRGFRISPALSPPLAFCAGLIAAFALLASPEGTRPFLFADRYALNLFVLILSLLNASDSDAATLQCRRGFAALLTGLAFCTHYSTVLIPFFCYLVLSFRDFKSWLRPRAWIRDVIFFIAGLTPFLWLLIRARTPVLLNWGEPHTWSSLFTHISRAEYGSIAFYRPWGFWLNQWARQYRILFSQFEIGGTAWPFIALLVIGLLILILKKRWQIVLVCAALWALTGELLNILNNFPATDVSPIQLGYYDWLMMNYWLPWMTLVAGLIGVSAGVSVGTFVRSIKARHRVIGACVIASALFAFWRLQINAPRDHFQTAFAEYVESVVPPHSMFITNIDSVYFPLYYHQKINGKLQNVTLVHSNLMARSWYLKRWLAENPMPQVPFETFRELLQKAEAQNFEGNEVMREYVEFLDRLAAEASRNGPVYWMAEPDIEPYPPLFKHFSREPQLFFDEIFLAPKEMRQVSTSGAIFDSIRSRTERGEYWSRAYREIIGRHGRRRMILDEALNPEQSAQIKALLREVGLE